MLTLYYFVSYSTFIMQVLSNSCHDNMSYIGFDLKNLNYGTLDHNFVLRDGDNKSLGYYEAIIIYGHPTDFTYIRTDKCQWPFYEKIDFPYSVKKVKYKTKHSVYFYALLLFLIIIIQGQFFMSTNLSQI